jgi:hypothetical protein
VKNLQGWHIIPQSVKKIAPLLVETYLGKIPARSIPAATLFCVTFTNNWCDQIDKPAKKVRARPAEV